ncbi:MAG: amidase [Cytophagales bacterium]|nr:amidase [Cytophagales bacterium]
MLRLLTVSFLVVFLLGCNANKISRSDIRHAQKIFGIEFTANQIKTMQDYLNRNREGYDSMRADPVGYDVVPAMLFDPFPIGFEMPKEGKVSFQLNESVKLPEHLNELAYFSVADLSVLIKTKQITSVALTQFFLDRIKQYDSQLEAVITLLEDRALQQARQMDEELAAGKYRGLLHGIPYGTKDLMAVAGYKTTWGAEPYKDQVIDATATVIEQLDEAGAVLIAKLVSGALARGDVWFGGKTKNPWDLDQGASGSSAGSGSATSAGLVPFALGTETLGSITSPSTRNGITGLRPTYGSVSRAGVMSLSWSMDKIGPMCRTVQDCAIVYDVIRGKDPLDPMSTEAPFGYSDNGQVSRLKIGYFKELFVDDTTATGKNNQIMLDSLRSLGYELLEAKMPESLSRKAYDIILRAEAGAFFDQLVVEKGDRKMVQQESFSRANSLRQSRFIPAVEYLQANRHRRLLIEDFHKVISQFDVILTPTFGGSQLIVTNLTGHPVLAIPSGFDKDNHPTSISVLGNLYEEGKILEFGKMLQNQFDHHLKHPPGFE